MAFRGRITDAVGFFQKKGEPAGAVRVIQHRPPERFRWRNAVHHLAYSAGRLHGRARMRIEEPVREVVLDLNDGALRRRIVLDARLAGVDLDRGEVLPRYCYADVRRISYLTGVDIDQLQPHMPLPVDARGPVDAAAAILVGAALADQHRRRAQALWGRLPGFGTPISVVPHHRQLVQRADAEAKLAKRWDGFSRALMVG